MKLKMEIGELRTENGRLSIFCFPFSILILLLLVSSCSLKKKLPSPMAHAADYQWMTAKMSGEITQVSNLSSFTFTGALRMRRDSTVWLSASTMGMEAVRVLLTNDSVFMMNRFEKTYLAEPNSTLVQTMPIPSLQETQTLLLGNGSSDHVEIQWGPYTAKIRYSDIQWDTPTTFPIKINENYERIKL